MADVQYASNAKANAALTTGIIGTSLGALAEAGGLAGLFGRNQTSTDPNEKPVTRYEMGLIQAGIAKDNEIAVLKSQMYADNKMNAQAVWNATQEAQIVAQQKQIDLLYTLTKLVIPNGNVAPGWGPVEVAPIGGPIVSK